MRTIISAQFIGRHLFIFFICTFIGWGASAQKKGYYTISEEVQSSEQDPPVAANWVTAATAEEHFQFFKTAFAKELVERALEKLSLLKWTYHAESPASPEESYDRDKHFGSWITDSRDHNCYDTRTKALIRDSKEPVDFSNYNRCRVTSGKWEDPYSTQDFSTPKGIEIDHVVALNNAYKTGAWKWEPSKRCLYANYLMENYHLLSVSAEENQAKLDYGPDRWMPSDPKYKCQHLWNWLSVKIAWGLYLPVHEAAGIISEMKKNNCDTSQFKMNKEELARQREQIEHNLDLCSYAQ